MAAMHEHPPAFQFYPSHFVGDGDVAAMETVQVGAYILLICKAWYQEPVASIPNDDRILAKWAGLPLDEWLAAKPGVMTAWDMGSDGRWHQKRLRHEFEKQQAFRAERSIAGRKGAVNRWSGESGEGNSMAKPMAEPKLSHSSAIVLPMAKDSSLSSSLSSSSFTSSSSSTTETLDAQQAACSEPAEPDSKQEVPASPIVLTFPTCGKVTEWHLVEAKLAEYIETFPGIDCLQEVRKARQWCKDNPRNRKTPGGMPKFLSNWLGRSQNSARPATSGYTPKDPLDPRNNLATMRDYLETTGATHD